MAQDPLSGHKATYDFLNEMLDTSDSEVEKADDGGLSPEAQRLYERCVSGAPEGADDAEQVCSTLARDFDRRHPGGVDYGSEAGATEATGTEVEKTISTAGMAADFGEPAATVELTDVPGRKKRLPVGT